MFYNATKKSLIFFRADEIPETQEFVSESRMGSVETGTRKTSCGSQVWQGRPPLCVLQPGKNGGCQTRGAESWFQNFTLKTHFFWTVVILKQVIFWIKLKRGNN